MIRKFGLAVLCATGLFSGSVFSVTEHVFQAVSYPFTLPPNEPQLFTNTFFWAIEAKCTIVSETASNPFSFTILRKSGSLNGIPLATGDKMDLNLSPGEQIHITAASGGRIELTNFGEKEIKAICITAK